MAVAIYALEFLGELISVDNDCVSLYWISGILGGVVAWTVTFILYMLGAIGAGDSKLLSVIGLLVGFRMIIAIILISLITGGVVGVVYMVAGKSRRVDRGRMRLNGFHYSGPVAVAYVMCIGMMYL